MERIDRHGRNRGGRGRAPGYGARLRPTGMVVFAALDETRPVARTRVGMTLPVAPAVEVPSDWRHRALRTVAWLLGR